MIIHSLKKQLPDILTCFPEVSLVYLFGSQVNKQTGPKSDIDLAVLVDHGKDNEALRTKLGHEFNLFLQPGQIDVIILNRAPIELAFAVIATGMVIYQRDVVTRVEFEAQIMSLYGDYLYVMRAQREQILEGDPHGTRVQRYRAAFRRTERTLSQINAAQSKEPQ